MLLLFKFKMYESNLGGSRLPSSIADRIATSGFTFNPCISVRAEFVMTTKVVLVNVPRCGLAQISFNNGFSDNATMHRANL